MEVGLIAVPCVCLVTGKWTMQP